MTVNLNEWRKDAEIMLARNQQPGGSVDAVHLARRLIAACKALEAYRYARTARVAGDAMSELHAIADAEDALAEREAEVLKR